MKYRWNALTVLRYGSGRASTRALSFLYCFFCSSEPVTASIHLATTSVTSFTELFDTFPEEAPRPPELVELGPAPVVERVDLARRALLGGDLLDVDQAALLDPDEQGVDGALGDVGEALLPQPRGDLVAVGRAACQQRE